MASTATEIERQTAVLGGKLAGRTLRPITACPYRLHDADGRSRILALAWVRGYRSTRPPGLGVSYAG